MPLLAADKCEAYFQTRRNRVLVFGVALGLFSSRGWDATTVARIARVAGLAKDSLYLYFRNKTSLLKGATRWYALLPDLPELIDLVRDLLTQELPGGAERRLFSDDEIVSTVTGIFLNGAANSHQNGRA